MGRLTLRQFYLLLAECYAQQRMEDARWYRLICCWVREAPAFGSIFPLWGDQPLSEDIEDTEENVEAVFRQVTAALTPYRSIN